MLQGANSTGEAVAKTKLANIKSKNARASLANITMLFPPDTMWRRGWSYVRHIVAYTLHTCHEADNSSRTIYFINIVRHGRRAKGKQSQPQVPVGCCHPSAEKTKFDCK